jgi:hypothetical protein
MSRTRANAPCRGGTEMDPYTEYLGTGLARHEPSYRVRQPSPTPRTPRRPRTSRLDRWLHRKG